MFDSFFRDATFYLNLWDIVLALLLSTAQGMVIWGVYRFSFRGVLYTRNFNLSLVLMAVITSILIMAVASNVVLSLGMVGALSIVRFRTAIKDPLDVVFLFWSISVGIVTGAGLFFLSIVGSGVIALILLVLTRRASSSNPYLLTLQCSFDRRTGDERQLEHQVASLLRQRTQRFHLKSSMVSDGSSEMIFELRLKGPAGPLASEMSALQGVDNAILIRYNGDYIS
ncbi:MAG TPA: DUF4956 domain-containing protein [Thermotogota bacterium]|nr:DUF4956 domain-containing protein [Thermotogota bacterium]HRW93338.1 DUF4956 domain-containing protein [Thermotogota bacterium]